MGRRDGEELRIAPVEGAFSYGDADDVEVLLTELKLSDLTHGAWVIRLNVQARNQWLDPHSVAHLDAADAVSYLMHYPGGLVAENCRKILVGYQMPGETHEIV